MTDNYDWSNLSKQAEAGKLAPVEGTALHGADAANAGRNALLTATGADTIDEARHIALGRPRLAAEGDENVTWKVRAPSNLDTIVTELAKHEGRTRSALIRHAVTEYALTHQAN
ncbi:ribbon-helix-helix domain-containing protein [Marisediminicola senii]|uniref:ribbon-helix-helix domain-containing protein n=1 Tax=Marisediminicola senii TaxID=2711233 RepID=UPI0013EAE605|nr:ribbon-helix-helix domain-containing protein [Marisediminicola senii]